MEYLSTKVVDSFLSKWANYALDETETSVFESLKKHMKLLSAHESDILKEIKKAELQGTRKRKNAVECWLEQVKSIATEVIPLINEIQTRGFVWKFFSEGRATNLDARVSELVEQCPVSGELVVDDHKVQVREFVTGQLVGEGFNKKLQKIWTLLVNKEVSCIGIHGMGGVGKTTLAKHINNQLVEESSYQVAWISVSQEYSVHMMQDAVAKELQIDISDLSNVERRSSALKIALSKINHVVLIFDDVWEKFDLKKIGDPLSINGCRLVITTRDKRVCRQIGCKEVIEVTVLQEHEAWTLFKEIHGPELNLTPEVKSIVKSTIQVCKGLPLPIITLAGSMRGETAEHAWSEVLAQFGESVMGQDDIGKNVFKVLKHSFDRLGPKEGKSHSTSQLCFLYCSTYPEDWEIPRSELIRRLIVEGYLGRKTRKACYDQGRTILDNLIYSCLLEKGRHGCIKMHDLLRAMALEINKGRFTVFDEQKSSLEDIPNEELWTKDVKKIFLWHVRRESLSNIVTPDCPMLSTLVFGSPVTSWFSSSPPLLELPDLFFSQMCVLCTLDVSRSGIERLPNSLSYVVSLKALLCAECHNLRYVPNLGKLKNLEELDLSHTDIEEAPQGLEELTNLKFLSFRGAERMKETSIMGSNNFSNIQCLHLSTQVILQKDVVALKHLEEFQGSLTDVNYFLRLIRSKPKLKYKVRILPYPNSIIDWFAIDFSLAWEVESKWGLWLDVHGFKFEEARDEDLALLSKAIMVSLSLDGCKWQSKCIIDDVLRICNPTFLERLRVINDEDVECLWRRQEFLASTSSIPPPFAQVVLLVSLGRLEIVKCNKVKRLGLVPSQFPNLEELRIEKCSEIEEIVEGGEELVFLPKLKRLYLKKLPRLKSICNATMVCTHIQIIELKGCKEVKKLPLIFREEDDFQLPQNYPSIFLKKGEEEWWEALELGHPTHHHLLKPHCSWMRDTISDVFEAVNLAQTRMARKWQDQITRIV